ncbi:MAG TPA: polyphosphate polymerase domain-containing protein [Kofleriaceae bacterium]|nr:polyphosphate polymerase domain-containing protein [Kofleriaceae bacterium]
MLVSPTSIERTLPGRLEHKFRLSDRIAGDVRRYIAPHFRPDPHGASYRVQGTYFDTPELGLYWQHRLHLPERFKLRTRNYNEQSAPRFFEVKSKAAGRSFKNRIQESQFLARANQIGARATVDLQYDREAYVGQVNGEPVRLTIDKGIRFRRVGAGVWEYVDRPDSTILEVKHASPHNPFGFEMADELGLQPVAFSKYCGAIQRMNG